MVLGWTQHHGREGRERRPSGSTMRLQVAEQEHQSAHSRDQVARTEKVTEMGVSRERPPSAFSAQTGSFPIPQSHSGVNDRLAK